MKDLDSYYNHDVCVYYMSEGKINSVIGYLLGLDNYCLLLICNYNVVRLPVVTIRGIELLQG